MKPRIRMALMMVCVLLLALTSSVGGQGPHAPGGVRAQDALGTSFTYQGRLTDASGAVDGTCNLRFKLYDQASGRLVRLPTAGCRELVAAEEPSSLAGICVGSQVRLISDWRS